jgi:hypothetical protein
VVSNTCMIVAPIVTMLIIALLGAVPGLCGRGEKAIGLCELE